MTHRVTHNRNVPGSIRFTVPILLLMMLTICSLSGSIHAEGVSASKGDYDSQQKRKPKGVVVPKSIYLTPKSDRLPKPVADSTDQPSGNKVDRQHVSPSDEEPWVAEPEDDSADTEALAGTGNVPEVTVPFEPQVKKRARTAAPKKQKKRQRRASSGRKIDVAYRKGRLKLNRFHTMNMEMPHHECRDFPNIFLADYKLPRKAIDILADNMLIVQKRICADNGAVMITCYQNNATISIRRAKPDDGCKR
ncbi:MAG: hypothetical protein ACR2PS_07240 [Pseudomonadales bacterium]